MRRSTRDEIHNDRDRREIRAEREANHDKWTTILRHTAERCGFRVEHENNGMLQIVNPDHGKVIAHAPAHVSSKGTLQSVLSHCGIPREFAMN